MAAPYKDQGNGQNANSRPNGMEDAWHESPDSSYFHLGQYCLSRTAQLSTPCHSDLTGTQTCNCLNPPAGRHICFPFSRILHPWHWQGVSCPRSQLHCWWREPKSSRLYSPAHEHSSETS